MDQPTLDLFKLNTKFFEVLVCPQTKTGLQMSKDERELISRAAKCAYPIHDGVPILLADEARALDEDELRLL